MRAPVVSPGALKRLASMRMQRCSISAVCGYSAWSMKLRWRFSAMIRCASGSIQVVTKVARLRSGIAVEDELLGDQPHRRRAAPSPSSGISLSGAPSISHLPPILLDSSVMSCSVLMPASSSCRWIQSSERRRRITRSG